MVKGDGGAIGLTENEAALTQWMIANNTFIRGNWKNFLCVDANKDGLFKFLATIPRISIPTRKANYIATQRQNEVSSPMSDLSKLCNYCNTDVVVL